MGEANTTKIRHVLNPGVQKIGPLDYTLAMFVQHFVDRHKVFNSDGAGIRMGARIEEAFAGDPPISEIARADHTVLKDVIEEPGECGYPTLRSVNQKTGETLETLPIPNRVKLAFMDAINEASVTPPKAKEDAIDATALEGLTDAGLATSVSRVA